MLNKIYIKFLSNIIYFIDIKNKKKIINFFKKKLNKKPLIIIDIGAHVGETISLFNNNFTIKNILAFEANPIVFKKLEKKNNVKYDVVIMVQGDEPMINQKMIKQSLQPMLHDKKVQVVNLFSKIKSESEFMGRPSIKMYNFAG